jgi:hypothetical protein
MSNNKSLFNTLPIFIPRVMDTTLSEFGAKLPALLMDSHHIGWRKGVVKTIVGLSDVFIVDPVTVHLLYPDARKRKNFMKLPYPSDIEPEVLYSNATDRLEKVIKPAVNDQLSKDGGIIIAPYFYAEDTDDSKFSLNLTLLSETIRYLEQQQVDKPIFANICIGEGALYRNAVINYMVNLYRDEFKEKLSGYMVSINDFDAEKADLNQLLGLSALVFKLSNGNDVFIKHMGGFGEVLCAIGASGFSSSLDGGEIFSVKNFEQRTYGFGRKGGWTYVSEIFDHVNDTELGRIGYTCSCPHCGGSLPSSKKDKKLHYLHQRFEAMKSLQPLNREQRIDFTIARLNQAISTVVSYQRQYAVSLSSNYLKNWLAVLKDAKSWEYENDQDPQELSQLLEDLKNEKNG